MIESDMTGGISVCVGVGEIVGSGVFVGFGIAAYACDSPCVGAAIESDMPNAGDITAEYPATPIAARIISIMTITEMVFLVDERKEVFMVFELGKASAKWFRC